MSLEEIVRSLKIGFLLGALVLTVDVLSKASDFSRVRSQKHPVAPTTHQVVHKPGEKYAILINGRSGEGFEERIDFAYRSLRRTGVSDENIFVLQGSGTPDTYVDGAADFQTLTTVFDTVRQRITPDDFLIIYATNHGKKKHFFVGESELVLQGGEITALQLQDLYEGTESNEIFGKFEIAPSIEGR